MQLEVLGHRQSGRFDKPQFGLAAEQVALSMIQKYPNHHFGWKVHGAILKLTGRTEQALVSMQRAIEISPHDAEAQRNLGVTLRDLGRLSEAEASYRRSILLKPDFVESHNSLGHILKDMGKLSEATVTLTVAAATTINVNSSGSQTKNEISTFTLPATTTKLFVTGDKALGITASLISGASAITLAEVEASANTGGVTARFAAATSSAFKFTL